MEIKLISNKIKMNIVIIGAGPFGCYAAYLLTKEGHEVSVYDRKSQIGTPIQCTGILTKEFDKFGLSVFIVKVNPEQTYFPKISSRILDNGQMESNPLHLMTPDLNEEISKKVFKYMEKE